MIPLVKHLIFMQEDKLLTSLINFGYSIC